MRMAFCYLELESEKVICLLDCAMQENCVQLQPLALHARSEKQTVRRSHSGSMRCVMCDLVGCESED